jgi:NAD(P)H-dependent FMN reductase
VNRPLAPYLRELLEASGLECRKHRKVLLCGRMVLVVPRADGDRRRKDRNALAALRRAIREHGGVVT